MSLCDVHYCVAESTHSVSIAFEPGTGLPGATFGVCRDHAVIFAARQSATGFQSEGREDYDVPCLIEWAADAAGDLVMVDAVPDEEEMGPEPPRERMELRAWQGGSESWDRSARAEEEQG